MTKTRQLSEEWTPCPPGTLSSMAGDERFRQRRQFLVRAGSTAGAVALAAGAGWLVFRNGGLATEPTYGGIACSRVRQLAPQFMMHQLDAELTQQITVHLEQCDECRTLLESMQPKTAQAMSHRETVAACQCSGCRRNQLSTSLAKAESKAPADLA